MNRLLFICLLFYCFPILADGQTFWGASSAKEVKINMPTVQKELPTTDPYSFFASSEVDIDIPIVSKKYTNRVALIIGNENYSSFSHREEDDVPFALRDALVFRRYLINVLGFDSTKVFMMPDATFAQIQVQIDQLVQIMDSDYDELVLYYSGHGIPDENTKTPSILPVDNLTVGIPLNTIYSKLAQTNAKRISVFLDACFTGQGRGGTLMKGTRSIGIKPKPAQLSGNIVVFSATGENQVANPLTSEKHGMFTYFLLRRLKETRGTITYADLIHDVREKLKLETFNSAVKLQIPEIYVSPAIQQGEWKNWRFQY